MAPKAVSSHALAVARLAPAPSRAEALRFDAVYDEHFDFVWRNLRRLGVAEPNLRDAAQEVFLVVHRRLGEFQFRGTLRPWLYSILRRVAAGYRRGQRRSAEGETLEQLAAGDGDPESRAVRGEALRLLLTLLERLDDDKREVLVLVDVEGMSVPEACTALDVNLNTLYARLRAARQRMRLLYTQYRAEIGGEP